VVLILALILAVLEAVVALVQQVALGIVQVVHHMGLAVQVALAIHLPLQE
jgi:hypothetical protein